jgi:hypothetical protein
VILQYERTLPSGPQTHGIEETLEFQRFEKRSRNGINSKINPTLEGKFSRYSESFCDLLRHSESSLIGRIVDPFIAPDTLNVGDNLLPYVSIRMRVEPIKLYEATTGKT